MDNNDLMLLFHDLFDQFKAAKPKWDSDRIYDELAETLSYAKDEWEESTTPPQEKPE